MKILLILTWISFCSCTQNPLIPFIERCHAGDDKCLLRSTKNAVPGLSAGIPALGINSLDPLQLDRVSAKTAGLNMDFRNTIVKDLKKCDILKIIHVGGNLELTMRCSLVMTGDYTLSGRLLIMPIEGKGKYRIRIRDMTTKLTIEFGEHQINGNRHWVMKNWSQQYEVQTGADFRFQNLYKGNKQLSDGIHQFANNNWRDIFQELAPPIVEKVMSKIVHEISKLFDKVPIKDLELN